MKRTLLQKVQYLIQERDHERAMREVLQQIKPSAYTDNRELMTEAAKLRDKYSTHAICDALQIKRSTFLNPIPILASRTFRFEVRSKRLEVACLRQAGGERGIRTPGPLRINGFQDRRDRPLRHLSIKVRLLYHIPAVLNRPKNSTRESRFREGSKSGVPISGGFKIGSPHFGRDRKREIVFRKGIKRSPV